MKLHDSSAPIQRLYWLTIAFGVVGCLLYLLRLGTRPALAFLLGAAASLGNLWLFHRLSLAIAPKEQEVPNDGTAAEPRSNPWSASLFVGRYIVFLAVGYTTVKALGVSPIPVLLGLLASTAAVLASSLFDLARSFTGSKSSTE